MMQNFGLEDLSHVQSRRNLLKYLVRVEMASDWFTRIYRSILAEQISSKIEIWHISIASLKDVTTGEEVTHAEGKAGTAEGEGLVWPRPHHFFAPPPPLFVLKRKIIKIKKKT